MVVLPIVFSNIVVGVTGLGSAKRLRKLGLEPFGILKSLPL
ncbi:hypothetical protein [Bacillus sp. AFS037270]|nr:hypothetical protein [Bacillus sp. AFS037270]